MAAYNYNANPYQGNAVASPVYPTNTPYGTYQPLMQQATPQQQPSNSILTVFVNSEEEVNFYPVAAGVTVMLVCFSLGKFYLKSTSKTGVPEQLRVFSFSEETKVVQENQNAGNYATKEEMMTLSDKLDKLIASLGGDK